MKGDCYFMLFFILFFLGVECRKWKEGDVKLVGGGQRRLGTVLVIHNGFWGSICDDMWGMHDATVVCRQLGLGKAMQAPLRSKFGVGRKRMWLTKMRCTGREKRLQDCTSSGWDRFAKYRCPGKKRSAGVVCQSNKRVSPANVRAVHISPTHLGLKPMSLMSAPMRTNRRRIDRSRSKTIKTSASTETSDILTSTTATNSASNEKTKKEAASTNKTTKLSATVSSTEKKTATKSKLSTTSTENPKASTKAPTTRTETPTTSTETPTSTTSTETPTSTTSTENPTSTTRTENSTSTTSTENLTHITSTESPTSTTSTKNPTSATSTEYPTTSSTASEITTPDIVSEIDLELSAWAANKTQNDLELVVNKPTKNNTDLFIINREDIMKNDQAPQAEILTEPLFDEMKTINGEETSLNEEKETGVKISENISSVSENITNSKNDTFNISNNNSDRSVENKTDKLSYEDHVNKSVSILPNNKALNADIKDLKIKKLQSDQPKDKNIEIRLKGGRYKWEGRLEIKSEKRTEWGTICSDHWTLKEAMVGCRELGQFGMAKQALRVSYFGGNSMTKHFYRFKCVGREEKLDECEITEMEGQKCSKVNRVAGLVCSFHLPDLIPDVEKLSMSARLQDQPLYYLRCAMEENCLSSSAYVLKNTSKTWRNKQRRLLRFSTVVYNKGNADFRPFRARGNWEWHACHMHYHSMEVFAHYDLMDNNGTRLAEGSKASFCLEDTTCDQGVHPMYDCKGLGDQGLSVNCSDNYLSSIDCQWIDITDIEPGTYTFLMEINPDLLVAESNFDNNVVSCRMRYTGYFASLKECHLESLLDYRKPRKAPET